MIFLSYSNADLPSALIIKRTLEAGGVRCWKAPEDILPGERWAAAIVRAIRESTVMVIVIPGGRQGLSLGDVPPIDDHPVAD